MTSLVVSSVLNRYGPREIKQKDEFSLLGHLSCELKYATFSHKLRRSHPQDSEEKEASLVVKEALEPAIRLVKDRLPEYFVLHFVSCLSVCLYLGGNTLVERIIFNINLMKLMADLVFSCIFKQSEKYYSEWQEEAEDLKISLLLNQFYKGILGPCRYLHCAM